MRKDNTFDLRNSEQSEIKRDHETLLYGNIDQCVLYKCAKRTRLITHC